MIPANKTQIQLMTTFMEENPDLAKSYSKNVNSRDAHRMLWEKLTQLLNGNGPPSKTLTEWKRIWTIRKYKTKQKLIANKKSIKQTGGGPFAEKVLNSVDEAIIDACGMEAAVEGTSGVTSFGCDEHDLGDEIMELLSETVAVRPTQAPGQTQVPEPTQAPGTTQAPGPTQVLETRQAHNKRSKQVRNKVDEKSLLLAQQQVELQEKFVDLQTKKLEDIDRTLQAVNNSIIELKDCVKLLCQEKEKERQSSNALKKEELQLKRMELELSKTVNELRIIELNRL